MVLIQEIRWVPIGGYISIGAYCIALYVYGGNLTYYNSFVVECFWKENQKVKGNKNNTTNISETEKMINNVWILLYWVF